MKVKARSNDADSVDMSHIEDSKNSDNGGSKGDDNEFESADDSDGGDDSQQDNTVGQEMPLGMASVVEELESKLQPSQFETDDEHQDSESNVNI